ncbi:MAG: cyclase family protein [Clostridia bacterium]|nr:cyclase family protein [Clostridia bacterium]
MKIYDISQEVFGCQVYPGDPAPEKTELKSMEKGEMYNLTAFNMCAHNGTHIDAPRHFMKDGKTVDEIAPEVFVGKAYVVEHHGVLTGEDVARIVTKARERDHEAAKRILMKGEVEVSLAAAQVFAASKMLLLGNEPQTVGPQNAPMAVHLALLSAGVVLLEGICLGEVLEGVYLLNAAPLNLSGAEGAPCRALLIDTD